MTINEIIIYIAIIFFSVILHEIAHGYVAYLFGDKTAKYAGRLTLNPQSHIDIFGSIILPIVCVILKFPVFGYAKPVPVNPYNIKNKWGMLCVSFAGILTNILLAIIGILFIKYANWNTEILSQLIIVNIGLAVFNLIPVPPFDGFKICQELKLFSHRTGAIIEGNILYQLVAIFVAIQIFQMIFPKVLEWVGILG